MITINSQEELNTLLEKGNVVIDFYADWCPPCRQLMPVLEKLSISDKFRDTIQFVKVNVTQFAELARKYEVSSIPTLVFSSLNKDQVEKHLGFKDEDQLTSLLEQYFT
ncbi:thioredoxin family protein [Mycoplasma suis]|uniref:Thioredoxin n=2 Tax=Mycoplasma suis TaxID=57372 RepID=F0QS40_MYCSL|nr:thioredoxin domain-containing protein [Mycoplasma suis]ADX98310.1 thioredoxin [Mycoplasma suis str. Illinois]CBZ40825.1 Thioredoxin [Mycoplasma suis KI3806]